MEKGLVSVIIPVYNTEKYIEECLNSVIGQTYTNLEIVVVDDGSKDNSGYICDRYALEDKRIKVIHKENAGVSSARNTGLNNSSGEYVVWVDADDRIQPCYVDRMLKELTEKQADMVGCGYSINSLKSDEVQDRNCSPDYSFVTDKLGFLKRVYENNYLVTAWGKLCKREVYKDIRYPEGRKHEDSHTIRQIAYNCERIAWINEALYFYRQVETSIMNQYDDNTQRDNFNWINEDISFFEKEGNEEMKAITMKLYCHYAFQRRKIISSELKKEIRPQYLECWKTIIRSKFIDKKTRLKWVVAGLLFVVK